MNVSEDIDLKVARIETILARVADNQDKMTNNFDKVTVSMGKMELLMEKLSNLEVNTKNSIDRIHKRIDATADEVHVNATKCDAGLKPLEPLVFLFMYPKIAILSFAGLWLITIKEVREPLLTLLGM